MAGLRDRIESLHDELRAAHESLAVTHGSTWFRIGARASELARRVKR